MRTMWKNGEARDQQMSSERGLQVSGDKARMPPPVH